VRDEHLLQLHQINQPNDGQQQIMRVFYKLDGFKATCLDLEDNGQQEYPNVARLVDGIKLRHANYLAGCDAPDLLVYNPAAANTTTTSDIVGGGDNAASSSSSSSSSRLDDLDAVPETDESTPLIVVSPDYLKTHHQQGEESVHVLLFCWRLAAFRFVLCFVIYIVIAVRY
jgi:hypothetical protein